MSFWSRIANSKLSHFPRRFKSIPYASLFNPTISHSKACFAENPFVVIHSKPNDFCYNVRFFAAPVQFQKQNKEPSGPRLNENITAEFVRLVMDNGHEVVSSREALARARQLNLDLVEVSGKANPPVCKMMDFNKEKFEKEVRDKERAKSKADSTLRLGSPKEVRFSGKTEQKDLQMKAEKMIELMEDGYKVKCTARGAAKQDALGTLSNLCALIQDVAVVESGPTLGKNGAYLVLRHVKFGPLKKGGGNIKDLADPSSGVLKALSTATVAAEPGLETDEVDEASSSTLASSGSEKKGSGKRGSSNKIKSKSNKGREKDKFSAKKVQKNPGRGDSTRSEPQFSNQGREPPRDIKFLQRTRESEEAATNAPAFRRYGPPMNDAPRRDQGREPPRDMKLSQRMREGEESAIRTPAFRNYGPTRNDTPRREPFSPGVPSTPPRPAHGNFRAPEKHCVEGVGENKEHNRYAARHPATRGDFNMPGSRPDRSQPGNNTSRQGGFGIFSRD